ncbi:MAG TPA: DUF58 domain-containing protein [Thermodesulfovibrionales bacterium]|nr:DUF58 domain-containing protein [Thermodesulfovibrionales bacterium]
MKLTREGKRFLLATALIAVAAVNTGNNLIYLILSLMLSFTTLSYVILKVNLSSLLLKISISGPVFAGEPVRAELLISNRKRFPAYSLNIQTDESVEKVYCSHVPPDGMAREELNLVFRKRGLYGYRDFSVLSGFPFILFQKTIAVAVSGDVLVYPRIIDVDGLVRDLIACENEGEKAVRSKGDDTYGLREYQYGDDRRSIHWKASARLSTLIVKEYAEYLSRRVTIIIDNGLPQDEMGFEKAVEVAASLAGHYIGNGYLVRVLSCRKVVPFGSGEGHLYGILDILAMLKEEEICDASTHEREGFTVAVLKSARSVLAAQIAAGEMVVYADTV